VALLESPKAKAVGHKEHWWRVTGRGWRVPPLLSHSRHAAPRHATTAPAWVFWHPQLFLEDQVTAIKAQLDVTLDHFQNLPAAQLVRRFRKPDGRLGHHFIVEDSAAANLPGARMAIELIKQRLTQTLFAQTP
jgi:hypothetical protein